MTVARWWGGTAGKRSGKRACEYCGTGFRPRSAGERYCCGGCAFLHGAFDARARAGEANPGETARTPWDVIRRDAEEAAGSGDASLELEVDGMVCPACAWLIEDLGRRVSGLRQMEVDGFTRTLKLRWRAGQFDLGAFADRLRERGYDVNALSGRSGPFGAFAVRSGICAFLCANSALMQWPLRNGGNAAGYGDLLNLLAIASAVVAFGVVSGGSATSVARAVHGRAPAPGAAPLLGLCVALVVGVGQSWAGGGAGMPAFRFTMVALAVLLADGAVRLVWRRVYRRVRRKGAGGEPGGLAPGRSARLWRWHTLGLLFAVFLASAMIGGFAGLSWEAWGSRLSAGLLAFSGAPVALGREFAKADSGSAVVAATGANGLGAAFALAGWLSPMAAVAWSLLVGTLWLLVASRTVREVTGKELRDA